MINSPFSPQTRLHYQTRPQASGYSSFRENQTCKTTLNNSQSTDVIHRKKWHQPFLVSQFQDRKNISSNKNVMKNFYEQVQLNLTYSEKIKNIELILKNCK